MDVKSMLSYTRGGVETKANGSNPLRSVTVRPVDHGSKACFGTENGVQARCRIR